LLPAIEKQIACRRLETDDHFWTRAAGTALRADEL